MAPRRASTGPSENVSGRGKGEAPVGGPASLSTATLSACTSMAITICRCQTLETDSDTSTREAARRRSALARASGTATSARDRRRRHGWSRTAPICTGRSSAPARAASMRSRVSAGPSAARISVAATTSPTRRTPSATPRRSQDVRLIGEPLHGLVEACGRQSAMIRIRAARPSADEVHDPPLAGTRQSDVGRTRPERRADGVSAVGGARGGDALRRRAATLDNVPRFLIQAECPAGRTFFRAAQGGLDRHAEGARRWHRR